VQVQGLTGIVALAAGYNHALAVGADGTAWQWGYGAGVTPVPVGGLSGVRAVAAGNQYSLFLDGDGTAWGLGMNFYGQLGNGTCTYAAALGPVTGLGEVGGIAAGWDSAAALAAGGSVWTWGSDFDGQLGRGRRIYRDFLAQVSDLGPVLRAAGGTYHTVALLADGTVASWGDNYYGELATADYTPSGAPLPIAGLAGIVQVAAGSFHTLALQDNGTVWVWGNDYDIHRSPEQKAGLGPAVGVAAGNLFSLAVLADGTVWGWGSNQQGQLGNGTTVSSSSPVQAAGLTQATSVAAGAYHALALRQDGSVWAWGYNSGGQLGDGTTTSRTTPGPVLGLPRPAVAVAAGGHTSAAILDDGSLWLWGDNGKGQIGDGTTQRRTLPVEVAGLPSPVASVALGFAHVLAVLNDGSLWTWGWNDSGQLGQGSLADLYTPVQVAGAAPVSFAAAGSQHSVVLRGGCSVACSASGPSFVPIGSPASFAGAATVSQCAAAPALAWDFGDGSPPEAGANVSHTYASEGTYTWTFSASADGVVCQRSGSVTVASCSLTCTAAVPSLLNTGQAGTFSAAAQVTPGCGTPSFVWDFGDGSGSSEANPSHTYATPGTRIWTLTATAGTLTCTRTGTLTVVAPPAIAALVQKTGPFRIVVTGSNLQNGMQVSIGGTPYTTVTYKSASKVVLKGSLLKTLVPKGVPTLFRFVNPDGGWAEVTWTR
jgi:alpha-tubulin suppressor-like RCC1 family protein